MLDRARPELIRSDLMRPTAFDPALRKTSRPSFGSRSFVIPIASLVLIQVIASLTPEMPETPAPLLVDGAGWFFVIGMLALPFSMIAPKLWAGASAAVIGGTGLALHAWCGLGGHVSMSAGWYLGVGAAIAAFTALGVYTAASASRS